MTRQLNTIKRKKIDVLLNPVTIEALDNVAGLFSVSRTEIIEIGIMTVFKAVLEHHTEIKK